MASGIVEMTNQTRSIAASLETDDVGIVCKS